ncbi:hypothetical protein EXS74_02260 [Candidatus Woesearchaeota archaeon]|nr:hypothetical protein [Candidatus Woesearchaeota archaeon]
MKELFKKPYVYWIGGIFTIYILLNIWLSQFYELILQIPFFLETINWRGLLISFVLAIIIGILLAINMAIILKEYKTKKSFLKKQGFFSSLGLLGGLSTGVCSACIAGFFPLMFSLFGITFSWAFLPFNGIEIQLLSIVLLSTSIFLITKKKQKCEITT